ncbi:MAG: ATP-binding cassette domain-containing protein [Thermodesulfobacteriota bacterium]
MGLSLEVAGISKTYNGQAVLRDCSFVFNSGRTYALVGPNGSGKSTFFRIAALLEPPDAGEVRYVDHGVPLPHDLALRRRITLLLPKIGVFNTSVFNNVAYGLKIRKRPAQEVEARVNEVLERVGLAHKGRQNGLDLSSGETKRLGIARALVIEPEVFLLDEPTANIDPQNTEIIEQIILGMKTAGKSTIIVVTHDPAQARRLGDHLLVMEHGKIVSIQ